MPGISSELAESLDSRLTLGRIRTDVRTDLIWAPHYSAVFAHAGSKLWEKVIEELKSGTYEPSLPITMEVPKLSKLTRPGSILTPRDRVVYQAMVDSIAPMAEAQLDRTRVYSNVLLKEDPEYKMFQSPAECWATTRRALIAQANANPSWTAIRTDVACFFEGLYQHNLINLLSACGCDASATNLLEKFLLALTQKDSHGIVQGVFPSDFLGNFYLLGLDADLQLREIPSIRYVDDIYLFVKDYPHALETLLSLSVQLRREGLHLNERKTDIMPMSQLISEETELDRRFGEARKELADQEGRIVGDLSGFQAIWEEGNVDNTANGDFELRATKELFKKREGVTAGERDKIDKFCLPVLGAAGSLIAVDAGLEGMVKRPHLARSYAAYLSRMMKLSDEIREKFESTIDLTTLPYDWQVMWCFVALSYARKLSTETVRASISILRDARRAEGLRAMCAIVASQFGVASQRRIVRQQYTDETSEYVRAAILFASRHFPSAERRTCVASWAPHSFTNSLVADAVRSLVQAS